MQWRNIQYSVVQSAGKLTWKWKVDISARSIVSQGEARSRTLAIAAAIAAIEKSVARQMRAATMAPSMRPVAEREEHTVS